jgi:RHS repeat-associated protein
LDGSDWDGTVPSGDQTTINGISRRGYTGHSMLGSMGLIHMNGRVQDAVTGRFLSPDPYVQSPGFTQSFNRYAYVTNNPLSFIDPSGFASDRPAFNVEKPEDELPEVTITGTRSGSGDFYTPRRPFTTPPPPSQPGRGARSGSQSQAPMDELDEVVITADEDEGDEGDGLDELEEVVITASVANSLNFIKVAASTTICQRRNWHDLNVAVQVTALRAAGFRVATNIQIRLMTSQDQSYAVADYVGGNPHPAGLEVNMVFPAVWLGIDHFPTCPPNFNGQKL